MKRNPVLITLTILLGLNILAWVAVYDLSGNRGLEVTFFDVGQGDAIFIETPARHQILIDGGPSSIILEKLGKEMPFWDRTIDLIILTHPEQDHMKGLFDVLKRYKVENILWTGVLKDTAEYQEWLRLIGKEGAKIYIAKPGQKISAGYCDGSYGGRTSVRRCDLRKMEISILNPGESLAGKEIKNTNDTSIVARLVFGETAFLFTGDIGKSAEKDIVGEGIIIDSDVLKVAHHGSKTSSGKEFIEKVSPDIAVISAGKDNKYGHPHKETLENLKDVRVLRTDLDGDIKVISDGERYKIKNSKQ